MKEINGTVGIPNSYFLKMAKHDYENYQRALPREFYQNSIDAGATSINVVFDESDKSITVTDNGCGMNLDTLQNKLLVLGGSLKGEGAVGAFGKAKEVLFFSWKKYNIATRGLLVEGVGADYTITSTQPADLEGTVCKIWLPKNEDLPSFMRHFKVVGSEMETPAKIHIDGELLSKHKRGKLVKHEDSLGNIHQVKSKESHCMSVRVNGIWMFDEYVGTGLGSLVLELTGSSLELLTSNRDGFKWEAKSLVNMLLADLIINKSSSLIKPILDVVKVIKGEGKITVGEEQLAIAKAKINKGDNLAAIKDKIFVSADPLSPVQRTRVRNTSQVLGAEWEEFSKHIELIGYEPDFLIQCESKRTKQVEKFMESKKARILATMWTEIIKQVLLDNKRYLKFNVGFTFNEEIEAFITQKGGYYIIYLNPHTIKMSQNRRIIMEELKDLAIHEIAHISIIHHDSNFVNEMAAIRKATYADPKPYSDIQRTR